MADNGSGCVTGAVCYANESMCFYPQFNFFVSLEFIAAGHIVYLLTILGLRRFMKTRAAMEPKLLMTAYNILQVVLSGSMTIGLLPWVINNQVFNLNGKFCPSIEFWVFIHYITKYLDMFDTVWMVLRKKDRQISFLHVYHHLTIGVIWGLLLHYGIGNGTGFYGAWINSFVHTLMYFHYLVTSFGINNPLKKYLTQFQMLQFASCILHAVVCLAVEESQNFPTAWGRLQLLYHATLLVLFRDFYVKSHKGKKDKDEEKGVGKEKENGKVNGTNGSHATPVNGVAKGINGEDTAQLHRIASVKTGAVKAK